MNSKKSSLLLTGVTGFLGSNLARKLVSEKRSVIALKRSTSSLARIEDIRNQITFSDIDEVSLEEVFSNHSISGIIHCATDYGRRPNVLPLEILDSNLILPLKLLALGKAHQVQFFINTDTILDKRVNHYSLSKKQFKDWLEISSDGIACLNVSLEHFYGPFDNPSKFVTSMIHQLLAQVDSIDLTEGKQKRDFIYVDDVVSAFIYILKRAETLKSGFYNFELGTNETVSIRELVQAIKAECKNNKTELAFGKVPYRPNEIMNVQVDTSEIKKLGWSPETSLMVGLKKTIAMEQNKS